MQDKLKQYQKAGLELLQRFSDIRFVGQVVFGVLVLLISWSGARAVQTNYGLQKQISALQQQNAVQQLMNNNLKLQNQYYNSNQYLDLAARQNFSLASPGETEILVPQSVALAATVPVPQQIVKATVPQPQQPAYQRNIQAWINFFLHHQPSGN